MKFSTLFLHAICLSGSGATTTASVFRDLQVFLATSQALLSISSNGAVSSWACEQAVMLELELQHDSYPEDISWEFKNSATGEVLMSGGGYTVANSFHEEVLYCSANDGEFIFKINDSWGDGLCCSEGNGGYKIKDQDGNILANGGAFGSGEQKLISVTAPSLQPSESAQPSSQVNAWKASYYYLISRLSQYDLLN